MKPKTETWYCWREFKIVGMEGAPRLLIPWSNPHEFEYPFDFIYPTEEEARASKDEEAPDEEWVLCVQTLTPVI